MAEPKPIPQEILDLPAEGVNLAPGTVQDQLGPGKTLLVFLRHTGCLFCSETVAQVRKVVEDDPSYPPVLYIYPGNKPDGEAFFAEADPKARALADLPRTLFAAFKLGKARISQLISPGAIACGFRAMKGGHKQTKPTGDPWQMSGTFLVEDGRILWEHRPRHVGDNPDFAAIPKGVESLSPGK